MSEPSARSIDAGVRIGHVHLKVADLERALRFYCDVLGFELTQRYGSEAAFVSAGGYHHHIGLNTWKSRGGSPPPAGTTGLYHLAVLYPTRAELADALRRVLGAGIRLDGASDHGVSEALYLRDPDDNGVELYWDRPEEEWPRDQEGGLAMFTRPLDLDSLRAATSQADYGPRTMTQKRPEEKESKAPKPDSALERASGKQRQDRIERKIDRDLEDSFPASDPPGWTSGVERRE